MPILFLMTLKIVAVPTLKINNTALKMLKWIKTRRSLRKKELSIKYLEKKGARKENAEEQKFKRHKNRTCFLKGRNIFSFFKKCSEYFGCGCIGILQN